MELYVYYRVVLPAGPGEATTCAAADEVLAAQAALRATLPGLQARLLRRADDGGVVPGEPQVQTWMEVYARAGGLEADALALIASVMAALPSPRQGPRVTERFVPVTDAAQEAA